MKCKGYTLTIDLLSEIEKKHPQLADIRQPEGEAFGLVVEMTNRFSVRRIAKDIARKAGAAGVSVAVITAPLRGRRESAALPVEQLLLFAKRYSDLKEDLQLERLVKATAGL
ncbi:hypothetical protein [Streptomyces noursei]|uniref:hypothetical protein n=1 Tax=Streptomyces noursei TaxID=1971 RepID=UPI0016769622|nr:hypothetical protein [Streptomyces noursei]MCZ1015594.1 hypothetical protein [Streptomyces noursei]GGW89341.1 hypothetical protein GCM10010341_07660 [Streptomyces noursei]